MRNRLVWIVALWLAPSLSVAGEKISLDVGWKFHLNDPDGVDRKQFDYPEVKDLAKAYKDDFEREAELAAKRVDAAKTNLGGDLPVMKPDYDDGQWVGVDLPHDWVVSLPFDHSGNPKDDEFQGAMWHGFKDIRAGHNDVGWYRRSFDLPAADKGKHLSIQFDGAYRNSLVWLNGRCLGRHPSGYSGFEYDITGVANYGGKNKLVVRCDASRVEGWFYEGAGIYRHVWLKKGHGMGFVQEDTRIVTTGTADTATVTVHFNVPALHAVSGIPSIDSTIVGPDGNEVRYRDVTNKGAASPSWDTSKAFEISHPALWSTDSPSLYQITLIFKVGGREVDRVTNTFGIRTIQFDVDQGFLLNGKRVEIRGTCNHQDHAGVGSAIPDSLNVWRLEQLKKFGCNALRTSHNPPTPAVLDACDRLGILVMDETRKSGDSPDLLDEMRQLVLRDRNHPSVILWSIGNEENGIQGDDKVGTRVATAMKKVIRELDDRPITAAMNGGWGKGFSHVIDVQGFNYAAKFDLDKYRESHPTLPLLGSENGSTVSSRGVYENDKAKGYVSAYDVNAPSWATTAESWIGTYRSKPYMAGGFVWTGFDYRGEPTPYSWPCINSHFGLLDTCGFFKDEAFYYQSVWTETPMVHVLPHWNWPGREGTPIDVWAYSNGDEVELFLNDQSLGRQKYPANQHVSWKVPYQPGKLVAKTYRGGKEVATDTVETAGPAAKIVLSNLSDAGADTTVVGVQIVDAANRPVPTANNFVTFKIDGGKNLGVGNGDPSCHEPDKAEGRSAFNGKCELIVQPTGDTTVTATAEGLAAGSVTIKK